MSGFCVVDAHLSARPKRIASAPAGNQTRVWSVAGTYSITELPAQILEVLPGIEPGFRDSKSPVITVTLQDLSGEQSNIRILTIRPDKYHGT